MTPQEAYEILRQHFDVKPGDGAAPDYEALDVLWSSPCQLSHDEEFTHGYHAGYNAAVRHGLAAKAQP